MPQPAQTWVRKRACPTGRDGGQCIADTEILTHHTPQSGQYENAPRPQIPGERDVSVMRGALTRTAACQQRNGGKPAPPADIAKAGTRYAAAADLRRAGFAVIHTSGRFGEGYGHVSVVWPAANPLDEHESAWPAPVQAAFAACFTEQEA